LFKYVKKKIHRYLRRGLRHALYKQQQEQVRHRIIVTTITAQTVTPIATRVPKLQERYHQK